MNYSGLITKFWQYNKKEPVGAAAASIYLFLLEIWKENEENDFNFSDTEICKRLKITRPTIIASRQKLVTLGMIQYQSKNGLPGHYKIILECLPLLAIKKPKNAISKKPTEGKKLPPIRIVSLNQNLSSEQPIEMSPPTIIQLTDNIPPLEEFTEYAKTLENYFPALDALIEEKYESWIRNGWKNGYGKLITNWKSSIKNTIPFLQNELQSSNSTSPKIALPIIKRPKSPSNE